MPICRPDPDTVLMLDRITLFGKPKGSGERRMVLVAQTMVKTPQLLILDEPCQGLDVTNRKRVLELVGTVAGQTETGVILVTHCEEEIVPGITHTLHLAPPDRSGKTPYSVTAGNPQAD